MLNKIWNMIKNGFGISTFIIVLIIGMLVESHCFAETIGIEKADLEKLIEQAEEGTRVLKLLRRVVEKTPSVEIDPIEVVIDKNGAIFIKDKISGKLLLFDESLSKDLKELLGIDKIQDTLEIKLNVVINKVEEKESIFRLRFKAAYFLSYDSGFKESGGLLIEPIHYRDINLNATIGSRFFGLAIGYDITKNFNAVVGVGLGYKAIDTYKPFAGLAFSF